MASINPVILIGHRGQDPEVRYTASGKAVARATLATNERWKAGPGTSGWRFLLAIKIPHPGVDIVLGHLEVLGGEAFPAAAA